MKNVGKTLPLHIDIMTDRKANITTEPTISVGVMSLPEIRVRFLRPYIMKESGEKLEGSITLKRSGAGIACQDVVYPSVTFIPADGNGDFELENVTIGVNFHWERNENQRFAGKFKVIPDEDDSTKAIAINEIGLERYLMSVISSEMSANASEALLRAHAVVSRSWLVRQLLDRGKHTAAESEMWSQTEVDGIGAVDEICKWYDREDHRQFDVCADDHCQRYQGITRQTNPNVAEAVEATRGEMLVYDGEICDARFSKCCGGVTECFENCWENAPKLYLGHIADTPAEGGRPFCDTRDPDILSQVLNNYDRETTDFFSWEQRYTARELSDLIKIRSGMDFGDIIRLTPIERTPSHRITRLLIEGSLRSAIVGKELEIRRWLSTSHLRSSAFDVERTPEGDFLLHGRGWGHGVGMCQIGAAVMGARGYGYRKILSHYFPESTLEKLY